MNETKIVVLGAGVIGLTTALQLLRAGYNVTVLAKHLPSDRDPAYASPAAGAIFVPESQEHTKEQQWELASWKEMFELAKTKPDSGVWIQDKTSFYLEDRQPQAKAYDWWKDTVLDYHYIPKSDIPDFADWGIKYRTLALNPNTYLHFLQAQCVALGACFRQHEVQHIRDAFNLQYGISAPDPSPSPSRADIVINCTGLNARYLGGVRDEKVYPVRGQLVVVKNPSCGMSFVPFNDRLGMTKTGEVSYIIEWPAGQGTVLGGTYFESSDPVELSSEPDEAVAEGIMQRAVRICPGLVPEGSGIEALRVIRHQVGYRPCRNGGARVELEEIQDTDLGLLKVVHNYGVGGFGYQLSVGVANEVVGIVKSVVAAL